MIEYASYRGRDNSGIHLVNPFDSWSQLGLLPSSSTLSEDPSDHPACFRIVRIAMNSTAAVAMWGLTGNFLAYTRLGVDRRWTNLGDIVGRDNFEDVAAYRDGLFYAAYRCARRIIALDFSSPTVRVTDMTLNLPAYQESNGWISFQQARLVNSSSGLFLVRWRNLIKAGEKKRREIDVYRLMDDDADAPKRWAPVESLGSFSFFLGTKSLSVSLSTADSPRLRSNCIYIPHDANKRLHPEDYYSAPVDLDEDDDDFRTHLMYNLGDKSWGRYYSDHPRSYFNGFWMTPRLL
ncbi:uncharacterized protein A4U43_C08F780 [Asparagus officinalis]|nr:uncharacterized protein A4U43_C08F780 [Asparagus officinalis]